MSLVVTGMNHRTSDLPLRERMAFSDEAIEKALHAVRRRIEDAGVVILNTCNRVEVYANHMGEPAYLHHELRAFLSEWHDVPEDAFADALYEYEGREAVGHLFRVASSLDSLVVGEQQILGQAHDAYLLAHREQATDKVVHALFQRAFSVAKKIRAQTRISVGKVSVSSVAVDLADSIFDDISGASVLVIGSGEMGEQTLKHLVDRGVHRVLVANRSPENALLLADRYKGEALALAALDGRLHEADIIITSTGAPGVVLQADQLQWALKRRAQKPIFVIDIAVPRDVDAAANSLDNVYLYTMDDLQEMADRNLEARRDEMDRCLEMVDAGVDQFWRWLQGLAAEPTIISLSEEFHAVRERELGKTLDHLPDLSTDQREEIEYLTKRIVNNILQRPLALLKQEVQDEEHVGVLRTVRRLFGLKEGL